MKIKTCLLSGAFLVGLTACSDAKPTELSQAEYQRIADESGESIEAVKEAYANHKTTDNTVLLNQEDEELLAARQKARDTFPDFLKMLQAKDPGTYSIKFPLKVQDNVEHIWLQVDRVKGQYVHGRLANKPLGGGFRMGQKLKVDLNHVEDWMIRTSNGIYGAHTVRYAASKMPPEERAKIEAMLLD